MSIALIINRSTNVLLWPPYVIGQAIIFCPVVSSSIFIFTHLISAVADWMSTIVVHMVYVAL